MNTMLKLTTPFVLAGVSASIAFAQTPVTPEVLLYDGFESGTLANWPITGSTFGTAGPFGPTVINAGAGEKVFKGTRAVKVPKRNLDSLPGTDPINTPRIAYATNLPRAMTSSEVLVFSYHMYDHFGDPAFPQSGGQDNATNHRYLAELRQGLGNPFASNQLVANGLWNLANTTFGTGFYQDTNMWFGNAPAGQSLLQHYVARVLAHNNGGLQPGAPVPTAGPNAPGFMRMGVGPDFRRSAGWKKFTTAYSVRRVEFLVNNRLHGFWNHNPDGVPVLRLIDAVVLNRSETPALDSWVDEFSVRAFPAGSLNLKVEIIGASTEDLSALPLTLELVPTNGNTNAALGPITVNTNASGEINLSLPNLYRGSYDLFINGTPWLRRKIAINMTDFGSYDNLIRLPAGDVDDSTEVDLTDIDIIIGNYLSGTTPAQGDLDLNGEVDLTDIDIAIGSYLLADD